MSNLLLGTEDDQGGEAAPAAPSPESSAAEWPFTVELLPVDALIVDHSYQRPVEDRFVTRMAEDFDETLVGAIDVSDRKHFDPAQQGSGDVYAILDGQQRWEAMKRVGKTTCYAATFADMDIEDEAGFFFRKNKDRRSMQGFFGFRARVVAGDLSAVAVQDAVEAEGFRLGPHTDHEDVIGSVSAVEQAWGYAAEHRDECLTPALRTIKENWRGQQQSLQASIILSLAIFWRRYPDEAIDLGTLKAALSFISTPKNLIELGRQRRVGGLQLTTAMAEALVETFNRRRSGEPLPPLRG